MLRRVPGGPLLTRADVPPIAGPAPLVDPSSVFNPGAVRWNGEVRLILRVQSRSRATFLVPARSADGRRLEVAPRLVHIEGLERVGRQLFHVYDPRLTPLEGRVAMTFAADTPEGCLLGTALSEDVERFELVGFGGAPARNGVLFPRRIGGRYLRLERPNTVATSGGVPSGDTVVLAESADLAEWRTVAEVFRGRPHYWDELVGPGPPPLETTRGWLLLYHGVARHFGAANVYQAGAVLLDRDDPSRVLGRTWDNLLEPREIWEQVGQVPNVVFPSGLVAGETCEDVPLADDAELLCYYGAADTVVGLASARVGEIAAACLAGTPGLTVPAARPGGRERGRDLRGRSRG